jgi:tetratricopeptide (TPR) repeat protein
MRWLVFIIFSMLASGLWGQKSSTVVNIEEKFSEIGVNDTLVAFTYFDSILETEAGNFKLQSRIAFFIGSKARVLRYFALSTYYLNKALPLVVEAEDKILESDIRNEIGLWFYDQEQNYSALEWFSKSLKVCYESNDTMGSIISAINIGNVFKSTLDFDEAITYYQLAIDKSIDRKFDRFKAMAMLNLGSVLTLEEKNEAAVKILKQAEP